MFYAITALKGGDDEVNICTGDNQANVRLLQVNVSIQ
jgi:hypothetical protein